MIEQVLVLDGDERILLGLKGLAWDLGFISNDCKYGLYKYLFNVYNCCMTNMLLVKNRDFFKMTIQKAFYTCTLVEEVIATKQKCVQLIISVCAVYPGMWLGLGQQTKAGSVSRKQLILKKMYKTWQSVGDWVFFFFPKRNWWIFIEDFNYVEKIVYTTSSIERIIYTTSSLERIVYATSSLSMIKKILNQKTSISGLNE